MSARVLVVDADASRGIQTAAPLVALGYSTVFATSFAQAEARLAGLDPDLVLLSVDTSPQDGQVTLFNRLGHVPVPTVVLLSTATPAVFDEVLKCGVADYLLRPHSPGAVARRLVEVLGRHRTVPPTVTLAKGLWSLDTRHGELRRCGVVSHLRPLERRLLMRLVAGLSGPVTTASLVSAVWNGKPSGTPVALAGQVRALRKTLEGSVNVPQVVLTDPGCGYRLVLDPPTG